MKLKCGHDSTYLKCIECEDPRAKLSKSEFKIEWLKDNGDWKDKAESLQEKLALCKSAFTNLRRKLYGLGLEDPRQAAIIQNSYIVLDELLKELDDIETVKGGAMSDECDSTGEALRELPWCMTHSTEHYKCQVKSLQAKLEGARGALLDILQSVTTTKGTKYAIDIEYVSREALKDISDTPISYAGKREEQETSGE